MFSTPKARRPLHSSILGIIGCTLTGAPLSGLLFSMASVNANNSFVSSGWTGATPDLKSFEISSTNGT